MKRLFSRAISVFGASPTVVNLARDLGRLALGKQVVTQRIATTAPMPEGVTSFRWSIHFESSEQLLQFHKLVAQMVEGAREHE